MDSKKIDKIFKNADKKKICIVGDVMLDRYMFGNVSRISPEAPVQVFDLNNIENKLGGSSNVSLNVKTLGAEPFLIGVIGDDESGEILKNEMKLLGQDTSGLIVDKTRPTTCKTRVISDSHHLIRIDSESKKDIDKKIETQIIERLTSFNSEIEYIILQDYNKGVLTKSLIRKVIAYAKKHNKKILVDPKFENFFEFKETFIFKPNKKEIEDAFGRKSKSPEDLDDMVIFLLGKLKCTNVVLTLGEHGMRIYEKVKGKVKIDAIKTRARKVADVSGAGDTVISTIAFCLAGGASVNEAVLISNIAAGLVVEEVGIVPIYKKNLYKQLKAEFKK
jgi:rfaE bifunctional protein kinase chain/domain